MVASDFVRVHNGDLVVGKENSKFRFLGTNSYILLEKSFNPDTRSIVDEILDTAKAAGLSVVRTWAFYDGEGDVLQNKPGKLCKKCAKGLDYMIAAASERGLKLLLVLTNYWKDYGGLSQYVQWATGAEHNVQPDDFYDNVEAVSYFKKYTQAVVGRVNTITGIAYRDDPAIFAWSIINEPRCKGDTSCGKVKSFIRDMSIFIKEEDPNHLVTFGSEGFYGASVHGFSKFNPYDTGEEGTDFFSDADVPGIDFVSFHLWTDNWGIEESKRAQFIDSWIDSHAEMANTKLHKPIVLTEFGVKSDKMNMYRQIFEKVVGVNDVSPIIPGAMFWHLTVPGHEGYNNYGVSTTKEIRTSLKVHQEAHSASTASGCMKSDGYEVSNEGNQICNSLSSDEVENDQLLKLCFEFSQLLKSH